MIWCPGPQGQPEGKPKGGARPRKNTSFTSRYVFIHIRETVCSTISRLMEGETEQEAKTHFPYLRSTLRVPPEINSYQTRFISASSNLLPANCLSIHPSSIIPASLFEYRNLRTTERPTNQRNSPTPLLHFLSTSKTVQVCTFSKFASCTQQ